MRSIQFTSILHLVGLMFSIVFFGADLRAQVTPDINSGNPRFPFPQFLRYESDNSSLGNLGTQNAPGVTHADMELRTREAWQIMCNLIQERSGEMAGGIQYLEPSATGGTPCTCAEEDGYYLLAAAYMGDKTVYDGMYMWIHDRSFHRVRRFIDGNWNSPDYPYSKGTSGAGNLGSPRGVLGAAAGENNNSATDGDVDIALAMLVAYAQWGENSGIFPESWGGEEINYKDEAMHFIKSIADTGLHLPSLPGLRYTTGDIGLDGYFKNGDSWNNELTDWASTGYNGMTPWSDVGGWCHVDYFAPSYARQWADWLESEGESQWCINQFRRADASSDWISGEHYAQDPRNILLGGKVTVNADGSSVDVDDTGVDAEDVRHPWRHLLNYLWHGRPEYSWDPVNHEIIPNTPNDINLNMGTRMNTWIKNNTEAPWNNDCDGDTSSTDSWLTYFGPTALQTGYDVDGTNPRFFFLNWIQGAASPASVIAQDYDNMALMYRQCEVVWDDDGSGADRYLGSRPKYFHEWFRLLGMLLLSGNFQSPLSMMEPESNLRAYVDVDKTFAFTDDLVTYTIDYRNYASVDAPNAQLRDTIPSELEFVSATGSYTMLAPNIVEWDLGTISGFQTGTGVPITEGSVELTVRIVADSGVAKNVVTAFNDAGPVFQSNEYPNDTGYVMKRNWVDIAKRALIVDKYADRTEYNPGDDVLYTIEFENNSNAGYLNGGRPNVTFSFSHKETGVDDNDMGFQFRLFHDADEAYIDYGNYRLAYYLNSGVNCADGEPGCTNGWVIAADYYQGGDAANLITGREDVTAGVDGSGKAWNQRVTLKFAPQLGAPTSHLKIYSNSPAYIHRGGLSPLRGEFRLYANGIFTHNWADDWSYDPGLYDITSGGLHFPITDNWADPENSIPVTSWGPYTCETASYTSNKIMIEEWDGYVWRRVAGSGPLPGRDVLDVVVTDTVPFGMTFQNFIGADPLGIAPTTTTLGDGRTVITWTIPKLLIGQQGVIQYYATADFPSGASCVTSNEVVINNAWIEGTAESPVSDADTVTITCTPVVVCPTSSNITLTSDQSSYLVGDPVDLELEYTQTDGTIANADVTSDANWSLQGGNSNYSFGPSGIHGQNGGNYALTHNFSHGTNTLGDGIEGTLSMAQYTRRSVTVRHTGGSNYADGIHIELHVENSAIIVRVYDGTTLLTSTAAVTQTNVSKSSITIAGITVFDFFIELDGPNMDIWLGDKSVVPDVSYDNIPVRAGWAGISGPPSGEGMHGDSYLQRFNTHLDSGFDLSLLLDFPDGVNAPTLISNSGVSQADTAVYWDIIPSGGATYIPYGDVFTRTVSVTYQDCSEQIFKGFANLMGYGENEIGICHSIDCGDASCSLDGETASIVEGTSITVTGSDTTLNGSTSATGSFTYTWYVDYGLGSQIELGQGLDLTTQNITSDGVYTLVISDPDIADCEMVSDPITVTFASCIPPAAEILTTGNDLVYCQNGSGVELVASSVMNATYEWFLDGDSQGPAGASATFDDATEGAWTVEVSAGGCSSTSDPVTVQTKATPVATIPPIELTYCEGQSGISLEAEDAGVGATYSWLNSDPTEVSSTNPSTELLAGVYTVQVTLEGCSAESSPVRIEENPLPTAAVSTTELTYCEGTGGIDLAAENAGASVAYTWLFNGGADLTGQTRLGALQGSYRVIVDDGECSDTSVAVTVVEEEVPLEAFAGTSSPICEEAITLNGSDPAPGTGEWQFVSGPPGLMAAPVFDDRNSPTSQVSGMTMDGFYSFTWMVSGLSVCTTTTSTVTYEKSSSAILVAEISADKEELCVGESITFTGATSVGGTRTYRWFVNGDEQLTETNQEFTYTPTAVDNVTVEISSDLDCVADPKLDLSEVVSYILHAQPDAAVIQEGPSVSTCLEVETLNAEAVLNGEISWALNNGPGSLLANGASADISGLLEGETTEIELIVTNGTCEPSSTTTAITRVGASVVPNAGVDQFVCVSDGTVTLSGNSATNGETMEWTTSDGSSLGTESSVTSSLLVVGENAFAYTISFGVCSETDSVKVFADEAPSDPNLTETSPLATCAGQINLPGEAPLVGTVEWTATNGPGVVLDAGNPQSLLLGLTDNSTTELELVTINGNCTSDPVVLVVEKSGNITTPIAQMAGGVTEICENLGPYSLNGNAPENPTEETASWAIVSGTAIELVDEDDPKTGINFFGTGAVRLVYTIENDLCGPESAFLDLTVLSLPEEVTTLVSSIDAPVCEGDIHTFTATPSDLESYNWILPEGAFIIGANTEAAVIEVQIGRDSGPVLVNTVNSCGSTSPQQEFVTVRPTVQPFVTIGASHAGQVCFDETILYSIIDSGNLGPNVTFQWKKNGDAVDGATEASHSETGPDDHTMTLTVFPDPERCPTETERLSNNEISIDFVDPAIALVETGPLCLADTLPLSAQVTSGLTGTYEWFVDDVLQGSSIVPTFDVTGISTAGIVPVRVVLTMDNVICADSRIEDGDDVTFVERPEAVISIDGATEFCQGDFVTLRYEDRVSGERIFWITDGEVQDVGFIVQFGSSDIQLVVENETGCRDTSDVVTTTVTNVQIDKASADPDVINTGESTVLEASANGALSWTSNLGFSALGELVNDAPAESDVYQVVAELNGCTDTAFVEVRVRQVLEVPSAFTPNGDGTNDAWNISNIETFPNAIVRVFNRWGQIVFEGEKGYPSSWDGKHDGEWLPVGTYYYIISLNESDYADQEGSVTLVR